jgi:hypothetical protein
MPFRINGKRLLGLAVAFLSCFFDKERWAGWNRPVACLRDGETASAVNTLLNVALPPCSACPVKTLDPAACCDAAAFSRLPTPARSARVQLVQSAFEFLPPSFARMNRGRQCRNLCCRRGALRIVQLSQQARHHLPERAREVPLDHR